MEFSRRGRATDDAGDGQRFPDPPPHGEEEPMTVMRDALLSQLHMERLRQEIIVAELAEMERAMALRAVATSMPLHLHGVAAAGAGRSKPCPFSAEQLMALRAATPMPLHGLAATDPERSGPLPFSAEQPMALRAAPGGHQTPPMPLCGVATTDDGRSKPWPLSTEQLMALRAAADSHQTTPMPMYGAAAADAGGSKPWPFSAEQPMALLAAAGGHQTTPMSLHGVAAADAGPSKPSPFSVQQLMALLAAAGGHQTTPMSLHGVAAADAGSSKPSPFSVQQLMALRAPAGGHQATPMPLHGVDAADAGWSKPLPFSAEQPMALRAAAGGHHDQATPMPLHGAAAADAGRSKPWPLSADQLMSQQNAEFDEHKLPDSNKAVPQSKPKAPMKWNCTVCQVQATSEKNLQMHYAGQKHLSNVATLDLGTKASDQKAKAAAAEPSLGTEQKKTSSINWSCSTCQARGTSKSTFDAHLQGKRHQQNIAEASVKGDGNGAPKNAAAAKNQEPHSAWNCTMCEAKCYSKSQFEVHCRGSRHQQKTEAIFGKRVLAKASSSRTANEPPSDGSSGKNASSEKAEKKAALYFCEVCNLLCSSSEMLVHHRYGKKHREKLSARK